MSWKNLVVQLFATTNDGSGSIGTAYPIAKDVLLSGAHVVGSSDPTAIEARWFNQTDPVNEWRRCSEILWDGREQDPKIDVVLLKCTFPDAIAEQFALPSAVPPQDHQAWASEGFPLVGAKTTLAVPLKGEAYSMADEAREFSLGVNNAVATKDGWQGASGSPVIVNDRVIGVITKCPRLFNQERMHAVPMTLLLQNEKFCEHIGYNLASDQQDQLCRAAARLLSRCSVSLANLLGKSIGPNEDKDAIAKSVIASLIADSKSDSLQVAIRLVKAQRELDDATDKNREAIATLNEVALFLIPASLTAGPVRDFSILVDGCGQQHALSVRTKAFVELGMARVHGRRAKYRRQTGIELPEPYYCVEKPADVEIDETGEQFKREFLSGLRHALKLPVREKVGASDYVDDINNEMKIRQKLDEGMLYYVFRVPDAANEHSRTDRIIKELDVLLPLVTFIGLPSGDPSSDEFNTVRYLLRILCKSAGIDFDTER